MQDTIDCGIVAAFEDELNQLYWVGYAEQLKEDEPVQYNMLLVAYMEVFA